MAYKSTSYTAVATPVDGANIGKAPFTVSLQIEEPASDDGAHKIAYAQPVALKVSASMYVAAAPATIQTGAWATGLFNCFDHCVPNCCMVWICPCVSAAQIASRIGYSYWAVIFVSGALSVANMALYTMASASESHYAHNFYNYHYATYDSGWSSIPLTGHLAYVLSIVVFCGYWYLRSRVRTMYQLPGSCLGDCCTTFWCSWCSLAQIATHVKSYKPGSCDFGPPDQLAAYEV